LNGFAASRKTPRVKLDVNENLFLPRDIMRSYLKEAAESSDPRLYPAAEAEELQAVIAKRIGVDADQVVLGGGGDQLIDLLTTVLLRPDDGLLSLTPTFGMYGVAAAIRGVEHQTFPLGPDFALNPLGLLNAVKGNTCMIEIVNPNNPTGVQFDADAVKKVALGYEGPVLVDEAYVEYGRYSLVDSCCEIQNLVVLRTLSKAYGLAGLRLGYLVAGPRLASALRGVQDPYPVSGVAIRMGLRMLLETRLVDEAIGQLKRERARLASELSRMPGVVVVPSDASFITFKTPYDSSSIRAELLSRGVAVRLVREIPGLGDCLRVTVAPRPETDEFVTCLQEALT